MKQTAIVTGTSSGLGAELASALIKENYHVVGVSRTSSDLCTRFSAEFTEILGDISDPETGVRALAAANAAGRYDLLINCAGMGVFGSPGEVTAEAIKGCINVNLTGLILMSEASTRDLTNNKGMIVNIASTAGLKAKANEAIYCAAKWGVRGYTESLKLECKGSGLRVVGVYPGGMKTAFWAETEHTKAVRSGFMSAKDVAAAITAMLQATGSCGVSDLVLESS